MIISVETRIQDSELTAIEKFVVPRVELAMKSANAHSQRSVGGNVLEPDQKHFLGDIESPRKTAASQINSHMDLKRIDETRGKITLMEGDFILNEKHTEPANTGSSENLSN